MTPQEALTRVLALTGLSFPRGVLGPETWALVRALDSLEGGSDDPALDPAELTTAAAAALWPSMRGPMEAALLRARGRAEEEDQEAFAIVLGWAADEDPDSPLARGLAVSAAAELAAAGRRSRERLRAAEPVVVEGGADAAIAAATAAGAIAADMLDLDPEDFAPEIAAYVTAGSRAEDIAELARSTGDPEIRQWARTAVAATEDADAPEASEAIAVISSGPPPEDPAEDLVWVPTILALTEEAVATSRVPAVKLTALALVRLRTAA